MERRQYDTDLSDAQWSLICSSMLHDVLCGGPGRARQVCLREIRKDYEQLTETSETLAQISMIHLMLRRLAPS